MTAVDQEQTEAIRQAGAVRDGSGSAVTAAAD
jgi:hypothetical protein